MKFDTEDLNNLVEFEQKPAKSAGLKPYMDNGQLICPYCEIREVKRNQRFCSWCGEKINW